MFAESEESLGEVGFGLGDGVLRGERRFDFGVVAGLAVDFVEIDDGVFPHIESLATAGDTSTPESSMWRFKTRM